MKNCKQIKELITSKSFDVLTAGERNFINEHISSCSECKSTYEMVKKVDNVIVKMKTAQPVLNNEEFHIDAIMQKINKLHLPQDKVSEHYFYEKLLQVVSYKSVRYALTTILIIMMSLYMFEEYSAVKDITQLESQLNKAAQLSNTKAEIISSDNFVLKFFYDAYKFARGNSSYVKLSQNWLLINKDDLRNLLFDYEKLDEPTKTKIRTLQNELLNQKESMFLEAENTRIKTLQVEIERLNNELQKIKSRRGK